MRPATTAPYHPITTDDAARIARLRSAEVDAYGDDDPTGSMAVVAYIVIAVICTLTTIAAWWL